MTNTVAAISKPLPRLRQPLEDLLLLLAVTLGLRLLAYHGMFGTDDLVYYSRALDVAIGTWSSSEYNGALRYAFNIPAGFLARWLGQSPEVVMIWPLACSLVEVAAVYVLASTFMNRRAGIVAAALLATAPLHVSVATRLHTDPILAMFITLAFALLWFGWRWRSSAAMFGFGVAVGAIFWTKEMALIFWLAYVPMLWLFRDRWWDLLPAVAGGALMLVLHLVLMTYVAGDPLHVFRLLANIGSAYRGGPLQVEDAPGYYIKYLLFDLRHVGLLSLLGLGALLILVPQQRSGAFDRAGLLFVVVWWLGLFLILSILPVSLSPLRFVMKQSNYISIFLAPLAILGGMAIAQLPRWIGNGALAAALMIGAALSLLQQADWRAFSANTKALAAWAVENPDSLVVGSVNNADFGNSWLRIRYPGQSHATIMAFGDIRADPTRFAPLAAAAGVVTVAFDAENIHWGKRRVAMAAPLPCWGPPVATLTPVGLSLGNRFAGALAVVAGLVAETTGAAPARAAAQLLATEAKPKPLQLFTLNGPDVFCEHTRQSTPIREPVR
jgi:4-amino-4-deoxy-L-arabinose transferase-like glycosyltransferase